MQLTVPNKVLENTEMKTVRSNLRVLVAKKAQDERRRISLLTVAQETGISKYTIYALADDSLEEVPKVVIAKLCDYFECGVCDLLYLQQVPKQEDAPSGEP